MLLTALALLAPAAHAADLDGDGCHDDLLVTYGVCVHRTVTLPAPVALGAGTSIGRRASFGTGASLGASNAISRAVQAGSSLVTGSTVSIGYAAQLGNGVTLLDGASIGNLAQLGDGSSLGLGAAVGRGSLLLGDVDLGDGARVGPEVDATGPVSIGAEARVARGASLGANVTVQGDARVGREVQVGHHARIEAGAAVRAGAILEPYAVVEAGDTVARGETVPAAIAVLELVGGARQWSNGTYATSCEAYIRPPDALHLYQGATGSGTYRIAPAGSPVSAYCDMDNDNGGWTKILQYASAAYTPSAAAFGTIDQASVDAAAKLSDSTINAIRALSGTPTYRLQGTDPGNSGLKAYIRSAQAFSDPSIGWGFATGNLQWCVATGLCGSFSSTNATYLDTTAWGGGNDCSRYFADYPADTINCYTGVGIGAPGTRCVSAGSTCGGHARRTAFTMWIRP